MLNKQKYLSQNFLRDPTLVAHLVRITGFGKNDTVIDIGAGTGIITQKLAKVSGQVLAVEIDKELIFKLRQNLTGCPNVKIYNLDIRHFKLPDYPYKVFANLPFSSTADIIHKLLNYKTAPTEAYLVVQREAAKKFSGIPHETQFSLLAKPWFGFEITWRFKKSDFIPEPDVKVVLLKFAKRDKPLITGETKILYQNFIKFAFNTWKINLKIGLKQVFTYEQWKRLAKRNHFNLYAKPTDLTFDQWLALFNFLVEHVDPEKYKIIE